MYFIAYCLHDFEDRRALQLLRLMGSVMAPHSTLVIMEFVRLQFQSVLLSLIET